MKSPRLGGFHAPNFVIFRDESKNCRWAVGLIRILPGYDPDISNRTKKTTRMVPSPLEPSGLGGAAESGSPFRPRRFLIRPLAQKAGFGGVANMLRKAKMVPGIRDTRQVVVKKQLACLILKISRITDCRAPAKCPTKVSHLYAVAGHWDTGLTQVGI